LECLSLLPRLQPHPQEYIPKSWSKKRRKKGKKKKGKREGKSSSLFYEELRRNERILQFIFAIASLDMSPKAPMKHKINVVTFISLAEKDLRTKILGFAMGSEDC